jgi:type I restriction enzyme S subunit
MPEWPSVQLSDVLTHYRPPATKPEGNIPVRFAGVRWYGAGLFVREERRPEDIKGKCYPLKPGTLIYNRLFAWKQSFAVVPSDYEGVVVSNEFPQFDVDPALATPAYLALVCSSPLFASMALERSSGAAAVSRNRLKEEDFLDLSVPCPPVDKQEVIVKALAAVDEAIAATEAERSRLAQVLKVRRAELMNNAAFAERPAGDVFDIRLGRQRSPERSSGPSMTPYLRSANVGPDRLNLDDVMSMDFDERERERYALRIGDVLVSEGSAGAAAVGMPAMWRGELDGVVCFQNTLLRYRAIDSVTITDFVRHWCLWAFESEVFLNVAPAGVNIKHIGDRRAKKMLVRLPGVEEQVRASNELDSLSEAVLGLRTEGIGLRAARAALRDALLAGEIDIAI